MFFYKVYKVDKFTKFCLINLMVFENKQCLSTIALSSVSMLIVSMLIVSMLIVRKLSELATDYPSGVTAVARALPLLPLRGPLSLAPRRTAVRCVTSQPQYDFSGSRT